jgi:heterodisulfide reductase subunit B2
MAAYAYFPGCSLIGLGKPYDESLRAIFAHLGLPLNEIPDWNCCGATSYMCVNSNQAVALAARNLAIAEQMQQDIVAPCAACYLVLCKAQHAMVDYPDVAEKVRAGLRAAGLEYHGRVAVRHPLDVLMNDVGPAAITAKVVQPLTGYRVAPYYGCQMIRPYGAFDDPLRPQLLDRLMVLLGATAVEYPLKSRCCGGSLMGTIEDIGLRLNYLLVKEAQTRGANMMATVCPLCQYNLEAYQGQMRRTFADKVDLPIVYFTQLIGLAFGIQPKTLGLHRNFVTAAPLPVMA